MSVTGLFYSFIYVSDFERSKKFYRDTLGWKLGTDEVDVAGFHFGDAYLIVHRETRPEAERKYGGGVWLAAKSDDVAADRAALEARGVKVGELLKQHWGEHQFYFDDPDGYHWSIGQHMG